MFFMKLKNNYWLIIGSIVFLFIALSSIIRSITPIGSNVEMALDWLCASVIYFFFGAIIGHFVDWKNNKKIKHPLWFYLTISFIILSIVFVAIFANKEKIGFVATIFFPFMYGIFFTSQAFTLILPKEIYIASYAKTIFNIIFLAISGTWLYTEIKRKITLSRILLVIMFLIFILGFIGCAIELA